MSLKWRCANLSHRQAALKERGKEMDGTEPGFRGSRGGVGSQEVEWGGLRMTHFAGVVARDWTGLAQKRNLRNEQAFYTKENFLNIGEERGSMIVWAQKRVEHWNKSQARKTNVTFQTVILFDGKYVKWSHQEKPLKKESPPLQPSSPGTEKVVAHKIHQSTQIIARERWRRGSPVHPSNM